MRTTEDITSTAVKRLEAWPSIARMGATFAIFMFHYLGQTHQKQYQLDFFALLTFCLLSGYLSPDRRLRPLAWLFKRYFSIMVPYVIVILPVIFINQMEHHKAVSTLSAIITILGGNLFLSDPVYVIAWYITFVLLLYCYGYVETFFPGYRMAIPMVIAALAFRYWLDNRVFYFLSFFVGLRICDWRLNDASMGTPRSSDRLSNVLFHIQQRCYPFFLVHGAVLLFFTHETQLPNGMVLMLAFTISCICAIVVYALAKPIQTYAIKRALGFGERMLTRPAPS